MVAQERLTEPRVTIEWLLAKPRSFSNLPAFSDLNGRILSIFLEILMSIIGVKNKIKDNYEKMYSRFSDKDSHKIDVTACVPHRDQLPAGKLIFNVFILIFYRWDLEKQEGCGLVAHERLTESRVTIEWLLAKLRSFSNLPAFLDLNGSLTKITFEQTTSSSNSQSSLGHWDLLNSVSPTLSAHKAKNFSIFSKKFHQFSEPENANSIWVRINIRQKVAIEARPRYWFKTNVANVFLSLFLISSVGQLDKTTGRWLELKKFSKNHNYKRINGRCFG